MKEHRVNSPVILIGVGSCIGNVANRSVIRETWGRQLPIHTEMLFFVGEGAEITEEYVVQVPARDDYNNTPSKVRAFFRYAIANLKFDYLFKCDENTYVHAGRLTRLLQSKADFVGSKDLVYNGYASGGAGYLLSRGAVQAVAESPLPEHKVEDVWVGLSAQRAGFKLATVAELLMGHLQFPMPENDIITAHSCDAALMRLIDQGIREPGSCDVVALFHGRHKNWWSGVRLLRKGVFLAHGGDVAGKWALSETGQQLVLSWLNWPETVLHKTLTGYESADLKLDLVGRGEDWPDFLRDSPGRAMAEMTSHQSKPENCSPVCSSQENKYERANVFIRAEGPRTNNADNDEHNPSAELGILFLHHHVDEVVMNNLQSIRRHNPNAKVVTMSADAMLPDGYSINATPDLKKLHSTFPQRSSDRLVCSWFLQRRESCRKWWIVEWDIFCAETTKSFYEPVWDFPFVASTTCIENRDPGWYWFEMISQMPEEYRAYAMGAVPFIYLMDEKALNATCSILLQEPIIAGNSELRFATAANRCGYAPCGYSPPGDGISWREAISLNVNRKGIFHPVKRIGQTLP
jgi:hypothetical protein